METQACQEPLRKLIRSTCKPVAQEGSSFLFIYILLKVPLALCFHSAFMTAPCLVCFSTMYSHVFLLLFCHSPNKVESIFFMCVITATFHVFSAFSVTHILETGVELNSCWAPLSWCGQTEIFLWLIYFLLTSASLRPTSQMA